MKLAERGLNACVLVGFKIDSNGSIEVAEVLRDWPDWSGTSSAHWPAAKSTLSMKYEPTTKNMARKAMCKIGITLQTRSHVTTWGELFAPWPAVAQGVKCLFRNQLFCIRTGEFGYIF